VTRSAVLFLLCLQAFSQSAPPDEDERKAIVAEARDVALHYTDALPNFTCDQDTDRYVNYHGDKHKENWKRLDRYTARLSYNGVMEDYLLVSVNGHAVHNLSLESLGGTISKGDFASALRFIFAPSSEAKFEWHEWASLRGRICYQFHYAVKQANSRWRITEGSTGNSYQTAYQGIVYIDRDTKQILKLTLESVGIPGNFPIQLARQELDYDVATIGGNRYLLPFSSEVRLNIGHELHRNVSRYANYRKFSADANITFH
jgi:hypothetical protein